MRSSWIRGDPKSMTGILIRYMRDWQTEEDEIKWAGGRDRSGADTGQGCWEPPDDGRAEEKILRGLWKECGPAETIDIIVLVSRTVREQIPVVWSHPARGDFFCGSHRKLIEGLQWETGATSECVLESWLPYSGANEGLCYQTSTFGVCIPLYQQGRCLHGWGILKRKLLTLRPTLTLSVTVGDSVLPMGTC